MAQQLRMENSRKIAIRTGTAFLRIACIALITLCMITFPVCSLPMVMYPLKPSPASGPYQDEEFFAIANETIYGLSNQTIPNGTSLLELRTIQMRMAKMNISPQAYPVAGRINAYLYYTAKSGDSFSDTLGMYSKPYSPGYKQESTISEAREYQTASQVVWKQISDLYPGVVPYRLEFSEKPYSPNEDPDFRWPNSPFSSEETSGLY